MTGQPIVVMAFADDLVLVTEHASHMSIALYEYQMYGKKTKSQCWEMW